MSLLFRITVTQQERQGFPPHFLPITLNISNFFQIKNIFWNE